jgi:hypothetical protein
MASADVATARAKATAINLIIVSSCDPFPVPLQQSLDQVKGLMVELDCWW